MVHGLNNSRAVQINWLTEGASFKEIPDFRHQRRKLCRQFQIASNELGVVTDNLIGSLRIFDSIFSVKEFLHCNHVVCLILERLDICLCGLAWKGVWSEGEAHHIQCCYLFS